MFLVAYKRTKHDLSFFSTPFSDVEKAMKRAVTIINGANRRYPTEAFVVDLTSAKCMQVRLEAATVEAPASVLTPLPSPDADADETDLEETDVEEEEPLTKSKKHW